MDNDEPIKFTVVGKTVDDDIAFELDTLVFSTEEEALAIKIAKLVDERKLRLYLTEEDAKNEVKLPLPSEDIGQQCLHSYRRHGVAKASFYCKMGNPSTPHLVTPGCTIGRAGPLDLPTSGSCALPRANEPVCDRCFDQSLKYIGKYYPRVGKEGGDTGYGAYASEKNSFKGFSYKPLADHTWSLVEKVARSCPKNPKCRFKKLKTKMTKFMSDRNSNLRTGKYATNGRNSDVLIQMRQEADEYQCLRSGFGEHGTESPNIPSMLDRGYASAGNPNTTDIRPTFEESIQQTSHMTTRENILNPPLSTAEDDQCEAESPPPKSAPAEEMVPEIPLVSIPSGSDPSDLLCLQDRSDVGRCILRNLNNEDHAEKARTNRGKSLFTQLFTQI
eukprot:jgi/Picre1/33340/NNA_008664.t1